MYCPHLDPSLTLFTSTDIDEAQGLPASNMISSSHIHTKNELSLQKTQEVIQEAVIVKALAVDPVDPTPKSRLVKLANKSVNGKTLCILQSPISNPDRLFWSTQRFIPCGEEWTDHRKSVEKMSGLSIAIGLQSLQHQAGAEEVLARFSFQVEEGVRSNLELFLQADGKIRWNLEGPRVTSSGKSPAALLCNGEPQIITITIDDEYFMIYSSFPESDQPNQNIKRIGASRLDRRSSSVSSKEEENQQDFLVDVELGASSEKPELSGVSGTGFFFVSVFSRVLQPLDVLNLRRFIEMII